MPADSCYWFGDSSQIADLNMLILLQKSEEVRKLEPRNVRVFFGRFSSVYSSRRCRSGKSQKVKPQTYKRIKTDLNTKWEIMKCMG